MKILLAKIVVSVAWLISIICLTVGGRILWFGLTPSGTMLDLITAAVTGLAFMVAGISIGLTGNAVAFVLTARARE